MEAEFREAVEKLNSDVRNYLTPVFAYTELLVCTASEADRRKLVAIGYCADKILAALEEFVASVKRSGAV